MPSTDQVKGRVNVDTLTSEQNYRGVNCLAYVAGATAYALRQRQEKARTAGDYDRADEYRVLAMGLEFSLDYLGIKFTIKEGTGP